MTGRPRARTLPYRLLVTLLYGLHPFVARQGTEGGIRVRVKHGPASLRLTVSVLRFLDQLRWLRDTGLLRDLKTRHGYSEFVVPTPVGWNWETMHFPADGLSDAGPLRIRKDP